MPEIPAEAVQAAQRAVVAGHAEVYISGGVERIEFTAAGFAAWLEQTRAEQAESARAPALRNCLVPGCLAQYDAIAAMTGEPPARPELSSEGWRVLGSGTPFPAGGHICPKHVEAVTTHLPRRALVGTGWSQAACACGDWTSPRVRWHGVARALWEEHLLADVLHAFAPATNTEEDPDA